MKQIPRDPFRFDLFKLLAKHGHDNNSDLANPSTLASFIQTVKESISKSLANDILRYGLHTEAMFSSMVLSIGSVKLLKHEDASDVYSEIEGINVPDFRLVLSDDSHVFVEVKNYYQGNDPFKQFTMNIEYLDGLIHYAHIMGARLLIAVFWAKLGLWTLVQPSAFKVIRNRYELSFVDAYSQNEMVILGDQHIGTKYPLRTIFYGEKISSQLSGNTEDVLVRITNVKLFCSDHELIDKNEISIAMYFMLYGKWIEREPIWNDDGHSISIEHIFEPEEYLNQGFEFIGSLSQMFAKYYVHATTSDGVVNDLFTNVSPGELGKLIPDDYKSKSLPLWRISQYPSKIGTTPGS